MRWRPYTICSVVGISNCPGAPRLQFLASRPNATAPAPDGFTADEVVALLAKHYIARADHVDPTLNAAPFDSAPFDFNTQIFIEVALRGVGFPGTGGEAESLLPLANGEDVGKLRLPSNQTFARCIHENSVHLARLRELAREDDKYFPGSHGYAGSCPPGYIFIIDCSEVVSMPAPSSGKPATSLIPKPDIEQACADTPFPNFASDSALAETLIPHCPDRAKDDCDER
ncbi:class II peroxidase [Sphaerobolus stellatus SS14]|uniref:Class II peroxidase n=1 Tax=Sphaerobolus stellatus (strain SS14) TaxID=990650 RepID=A0A0C9V2Z1_SPHS4|nr:class II peroxidase [Sphaerobolus stellatus SS14]